MAGHTTTVPAFVRTEAGTVQVDEGQPLPADTIPTEIARLVVAGVVVEDPEPTGEPDTAATVAPPQRGSRRGQSGSTRKD